MIGEYDGLILSTRMIPCNIFKAIRNAKDRVNYFRKSMLDRMDDINAISETAYMYMGKTEPAIIKFYADINDDFVSEDDCKIFPRPSLLCTREVFRIRDYRTAEFVVSWEHITDVTMQTTHGNSSSESYTLYYTEKNVPKKVGIIISVSSSLEGSALQKYRSDRKTGLFSA